MSNVRAPPMRSLPLLKPCVRFHASAALRCFAQALAHASAGCSLAASSLSLLRSASVVLAPAQRHGAARHTGCLQSHTLVSHTRALRADALRRAISSLSRFAAVLLGGTIMRPQSQGKLVGVLVSSNSMLLPRPRPNTSIERTYNSGLRFFAPASPATLLSAAHVKR